MAIFTSDDGLFEIEALSFTPTSLVWGENVSCTATITNKSGTTIKKPDVVLNVCYKDYGPNYAGHNQSYFITVGEYESTTAWKNNASITVTISGQVKSSTLPSSQKPDAFTSRELPAFKLRSSSASASVGAYLFVCDLTDGSDVSDIFPNLYGTNHEYFAILDQYYLPTISDTFAVNRKNDESAECWTTLQVGYADGLTDVQKARMTCKAYYDGTEITLPDSITQDVLVAGITENYDFLSNQPVDIADDHVIKVVFGDQYEQAEDSRTVMRCFANLHLSGYRTGGVCVGGFCDDEKDSDGNHIAKFECYYPAYFYNGITVGGGSGGSIELEADTLLFGFMSNGKKDIYLTVPVPYMPSSVTTVTVTSIKGNVRCAGGYGAASGYVEGGTDYTSLVAAVTPCPSIGAVTIKLTRSTAMNGTNNYALTFQVSELKMTIS